MTSGTQIDLGLFSGRGFCPLQLMLIVAALLGADGSVAVAQLEPDQRFNNFVKQQAAILRANDHSPSSTEEWAATRAKLRATLKSSWGVLPESSGPPEARNFGELQREGYRIEKIAIQTMPEIWMTANAYVPKNDSSRKYPAVLCVHGHWSGAKQDPVVQSRCIGLVKLGFFVLCVDAFGAGERAIDTKLGEYHGEMTGAMLLPLGTPLSGIQVYENMRAVDYLLSRREVDPDRVGITGASGGGNQSMYAGAFDERFKCVVPTCSVGNYQAYLSAACCMCEVVPGILRHSEEGNVLGLAANRGLMVTSATQDAFQFSVEQAKISVGRAQEIASLISSEGRAAVKHTIIESPHNYNKPMREAMYGWMTKHLKGEGDGSPIPEPEISPEEPESLRCFPGDTRPDDFVTLPKFAGAEARRILRVRSETTDKQRLAVLADKKRETDQLRLAAGDREALAQVLGGMPDACPLNLQQNVSQDEKSIELLFDTEPGLEIIAKCDNASPTSPQNDQKIVILVDIDHGADETFSSSIANELREKGFRVVAPELRATGRFAITADKIGNAPDHNSAEWSLWIGRPLLGQWVWDIHRTLDAIQLQHKSLPSSITIVGIGSSSMIAIAAAALDTRLSAVKTVGGLASYVTDRPYRGQRLGILVPGLLREVGDVGHVAAMIAPRPLVVEGAVKATGDTLSTIEIEAAMKYCRDVYVLHGTSEHLTVHGK